MDDRTVLQRRIGHFLCAHIEFRVLQQALWLRQFESDAWPHIHQRGKLHLGNSEIVLQRLDTLLDFNELSLIGKSGEG